MNFYQEYTDPQLIGLIVQSDQQAFDELYRRHWTVLYQSAYYLLRDREASLDIVQDVFVWLWAKREQLHITSVSSYLRAAVKFKVANYIRSGNIRDSFFSELAERPVPGGLSPENLLEASELKAIIDLAIKGLPEKCRQIYLLSRNEQLSNIQIALQLGLSVKTVENQMTIALRRIRGAVEPYLIGALLAHSILS